MLINKLTFICIFLSFNLNAKLCIQNKEILKKSKLFQTLMSCENNLVSQNKKKNLKNRKISSSELAELCSDPFAYVCKKQIKLDSKCKFQVLNFSDSIKTPKAQQILCDLKQREDLIYQKNFKKCIVSNRYSKEACKRRSFGNIAKRKVRRIKAIFSDVRISHLNNLFKKVKNNYLKIISNSTRIPFVYKSELKNRIEKVELALSNQDLLSAENNECFFQTNTSLSTGIYNRVEQSKIYICSGVVVNYFYLNKDDLAHTLAHELSHSIDPCLLEKIPPKNIFFSIGVDDEIYPSLKKCIRGGNCGKSILNCNTIGKWDLFANYPQFNNESSKEYYRRKISDTCPKVSSKDSFSSSKNASDYKTFGNYLDQYVESFADFFASDVVAKILNDENANYSRRKDALYSISATMSSLHGNCAMKPELDKDQNLSEKVLIKKYNTRDEHAPAFLRLNRVIMSNQRFREAIGCGEPPSTIGAKLNCGSI